MDKVNVTDDKRQCKATQMHWEKEVLFDFVINNCVHSLQFSEKIWIFAEI